MVQYKINEDLAEETGMHVGDGSMNFYNGVPTYTIACHHIDDKEYMDKKVVPLFHRIYSTEPKTRIWSKGTYGFRVYTKDIIKFKNNILKLPLGKKSEIDIPDKILRKQILQKAFLRGFVDTDGGINTFLANKKTIYPRIEMCNISKKLMIQINEILQNMGFRTSIWVINKKNVKWHEGLRLTLNGFEMLKKWKDEIGFSNPKNLKKLKLLGI